MKLNSRGLALILAVSISAMVMGGLYLLPAIPVFAFWFLLTITFSTTYILIYVMLEFLFFRELRDIHEMFKKIRNNDLSGLASIKRYKYGSFGKIYKEIQSLAQIKQREIDELKRMAKFRRRFLADVSHELKTPIFAAQGFVYTLLDGAVDDMEIRMKFLRKAARSLDGLDLLVQDLLTISSMESGDITMQMSEVNICEIVFEVFDQLENKAANAHVKLLFNHSRGHKIWVKADGQRIYQVLLNLVSNGIIYSNEGGQVHIGVAEEQSSSTVTISVQDDGIGIPANHLSRIFERFYRVDKSRSKAKGGTGLGLSIVKHIVEAHGARVKVVSKEGQGSTFSFELKKHAIIQ